MRVTLLALALITSALIAQTSSAAGYFELSGNGSYYKNNNGVVAGDQNYSITQRVGGGIAYRFLTNTAIELSYSDSRNYETLTQTTADGSIQLRSRKKTKFQILSLDLLLYFNKKGARFRPYIRAGGGYVVRKVQVDSTQVDVLAGNVETTLASKAPTSYAMSANGGAGFNVFVSERIALEANATAYFTELNEPEIYVHYSIASGLRYVF